MSGRLPPRLLGAVAACALTGCAMGRNEFIPLNAGTSFASRPVGAPVVLTVGDLDRGYQEIGVIHVIGQSRLNYEQLNEQMRAKAREAGADAVIFVRYGREHAFSLGPFSAVLLTAEGLAVRSQSADASIGGTR